MHENNQLAGRWRFEYMKLMNTIFQSHWLFIMFEALALCSLIYGSPTRSDEVIPDEGGYRLQIFREGSDAVVYWQSANRPGVLQVSSEVSGPWMTLVDAPSPYREPISEAQARFFRRFSP
jgi:hypothetical protein